MSSPDLRAHLPALSAAGEAVAASAGSLEDVSWVVASLPPAAVDAALPGSATSHAFGAAVRAWAVVSRCVAEDLRSLGLRLRQTADELQSTDAALGTRLSEEAKQ